MTTANDQGDALPVAGARPAQALPGGAQNDTPNTLNELMAASFIRVVRTLAEVLRIKCNLRENGGIHDDSQ